MHTYKSAPLTALVVIITFIFLITSSSKAKSLYVGMHNIDSKIRSYKISDDHLQYQTDSQGYSFGWTGMTLDPYSGIAFATAEDNHNIFMLNAHTMIFEGIPTEVEGATSTDGLSGIVFDQSKQKLYVADRQTQHLFVYLWNSESKALTPESESYYTLNVPYPYAYGIDLDKMRGELYVTNSSNIVYRYDTNTWQYKGSISLPRQAVGISIDSQRHYMYTGSFTGESGSHYYLVRTDINDLNNPTFSEKNIGDGNYVIGLAMDEDTGFLYIGTTNPNLTADTIQVYNTLTWPSGPSSTLNVGGSGPAGLCLGGNVEYKPPLFYFNKVKANPNEPNSVPLSDYITYRITYGPNGFDHDDVVLTDFLPDEVKYLSSDHCGTYNHDYNTITWQIGHLNADDPCYSVTLTGKINNYVESNGSFTNYCTIESNVAYNDANRAIYLYCPIDDFNSYPTAYGDDLRHVWNDYGIGGNNTCAQISLWSDPNLGGYSMKYQFLNKSYSPYYSEVNATIGSGSGKLDIDPNWSGMNAKTLTLWFYGQAGNDANHPMYVTLVDSNTPAHSKKVLYSAYGNMNDIREEEWHEWNIPLADFNGVNLAKVKTIVIGFGDKTKAVTDGTVYFENIRLYLNKTRFPGCWPSDFDLDCVVDFYDFAILAQNWLTDNPDISLDDDNDIDTNDLACFCEDWLWQAAGATSMHTGYSELLYSPPPSGELAERVELQSAPQPQMQPESATEPPQPEPQYEPVHTTQELIDWLQGLLDDEQIKNTPTEDNIRKIIESLKEELQNQSVTVTP